MQELLLEYETVCIKKGLHCIWLTTGEDNTSARHAYERYGFRIDGKTSKGLLVYKKELTE